LTDVLTSVVMAQKTLMWTFWNRHGAR